jgi:PAS domain S-box-containing protein
VTDGPETAPGRDWRIAAFSALLFATALGTGLAAEAVAGRHGGTPWGQAPLVLAVLALASHLLIRVQCGDDMEALDLFEAVLAPTIVVFPGPVAVGLAIVAKGLVGALHRNAPVKTTFNAAQWGAATGCGALVFAALRSGEGLPARNVLALALAILVVAVVNYTSVAAVLALATRRPIRVVLAELRPVIPIGWVGGSAANLVFGLLFVSAYLRTPFAVVLMVAPLVVLHWGSRGFATARTDRVRLAGLQAATHALARPIDPREAVPAFLAEVRHCFEAEAVDLLELSPGGPVLHRVAGDAPYAAGPDDGTSTAALLAMVSGGGSLVVDSRDDALLAREGWRVAAAAPVRTGEKSFGVLCVYNRGGTEGFERGEVAVLEALAAEVAGALDKAALLDAILDERRRLADIVGNTSDGILTLDAGGVVTTWNAGIEQITGYDAEVMVGRLPDGVLRPRDGQGAPLDLAAWAGRTAALPTAVEVTCEDGQSRWLSCTYGHLPARDGRGAQLVVMARDVTKVHELDKLKDDFVAVVSHELRTPLAPIKGWAVTLLQRADELSAEQRQEGARAILRQADRLHQLILNILEDSRVETDLNAGPATEEAVDAAAAVAKVVDDFALLAPDRRIVLSGADDVAFVAGRAVRIEQVVTNLVANAVKYAPKGLPIDVSIERASGIVSIAVTDRGPGIPPEARERIFQRFERLADTPAQTGTGLGLYIARHLATTMGGTLDVAPAPGGGSTFTLRMRAVRRLAAVG